MDEAPPCGRREGEADDGELLRCACGSLLARLVPAGVELKCRRCKRIVVIPITAEEDQATG